MLKRNLGLFLGFGAIHRAIAFNIKIQPSGHEPRCMTVFSLTAPFVGVPICAPPFGEVKDNVNLEDLGLTNDDVAGYGFGFSQSNTENVQVKPDFYVKLHWRPEYVEAEYKDDFCFHSLSGFFPMNDVDNQAMCQHVFAPKGLRVNCNNRNFKCPSIANPFYKPSEQSNLNQKDFEVAGSQEVGSGAIYGSKVPNEATALSTTENSLEVIPNFTPGARQPQQLSDASYLDLGNANAGLWPSSSKGKDPSISFSSKGKRNVRGLLNHFKVQML